MNTNRHGPLEITPFVDPIIQENGFVVRPHGLEPCWIIDPGLPPVAEEMAAYITQRHQHTKLEQVLLTHGHFDHIAGINDLRDMFPSLPVAAPKAEANLLGDSNLNASAAFGMPIEVAPADRFVEPDTKLFLGPIEFEVLDVSGHSPGGLAFYCEAAKIVFVGDSLFAGSIGRTDLLDGDEAQLLGNIRRNLLTLPDDTTIYPGHGPTSTIGIERADNPFLISEYGGA